MKKNNLSDIDETAAEKINIERNKEAVEVLKNREILALENDELKVKLLEKDNQYKRAVADYQNLEKRSAEMRSDWIRSASRQVILRLLSVLDTLQMAQKHADNSGLKISIQQFHDALKQEGVTQIETLGKQFDPLLMECIQTTEGKDGIVLEELRTGYLLDEKVLRVAQVIVGKKTVEKNLE